MLNVIKPALKMLDSSEKKKKKMDKTHRFFIVLMKYADVSQFYLYLSALTCKIEQTPNS